MKLLRTGLITILAFLAGIQSAFAACTLNGQEIPCGEIPGWVWAIPIVAGVIGIFGFIFWLWMLIDAIKNEKENKTMWVLLIIFLNFLGALIYYFVAKRKRAKV